MRGTTRLPVAAIALVACGGPDPAPAPAPRTPVAVAQLPACAELSINAVDDNTVFMRRLYSIVGAEGADKAPRDAAAIAAGVRAGEESWRDTTGTSHIVYYLSGTERAGLSGYLTALAKHDPAGSTVPADRRIVLERVAGAPPTWRTHFVERTPIVEATDVVSAEAATVEYPEAPGYPAMRQVQLRLVFNAKGADKLARGTAANAGGKLAIVVDGVVLAAPIVENGIAIGSVAIGLPDATEAQIKTLAARLGKCGR